MNSVSTELSNLVRLDRSGIGPASASLTRAFFDYPLMEYIFPSETERVKGLPRLFEYYLYYSICYGEVYATSLNFEGVAIWIPSKKYPMNFWRELFSVPLAIILGMFGVANSRMKDTDGYMDGIHRRLVPGPHWYLGTLGVAPEFHGKGFASKLLVPMFERIDREHLPCYLETQVEARVSLYEHFGFKMIDKSIIPGTGIPSWGMLRSPS